MDSGPPPARDAERVLALARRDRRAAREALARLDDAAQLALACETPLARRGEVLALLPHPERVIPLLPEAELCFTARAVGLADAGWLLAHATPEQLVACADLDVWQDDGIDVARVHDWIEAFADAGDETLLRSVQALDPELITIYLASRVEVWLKPDDEWQPPPGAQTVDGQFWLRARAEDDDLSSLLRLAKLRFDGDYWGYFRMLQGVVWEPPTETALWAARWRDGRLLDLGFPPWEEALGIYALLPDTELDAVPDQGEGLAAAAWHLPIWPPRLPATPDARHALFRAAARLDEDERRALLYALLAAANAVAVLDSFPLGDPESVPRAIERVAALASAGLEHLADVHVLDAVEVLRRVPLQRLVRVGRTLDVRARTDAALSDGEREERT